MNPTISVRGVNHRGAALDVRERLCRGPADLPEALAAAGLQQAEVAVLSTCNRTEVYVASSSAHAGAIAWQAATGSTAVPGGYGHRGSGAVRHLLEVACGVDSAILGDQQILGQVRATMSAAAAAGTLGPHLQRVFSLGVATARRARRGTSIGAGAPGVGAGVVRALARHGVPPAAEVAVLGAGAAAEAVAKHLHRAGFAPLFLNRTPAGAQGMVARFGGRAAAWEALEPVLASVDVVVAATGARAPVLPGPVLRRAAAARPARAATAPLLVVDAGMPRNAEPTAGVVLLDLDDLDRHAAEDSARREAALPAVHALIDQAVAAWAQQQGTAPVEQAIKALYRDSEVAAARLAHLLAGDASVGEAERLVRRTLAGVLHDHVGRLRALPIPPAVEV